MLNVPNGLTMTRCIGSLFIWPALAIEAHTWMWVACITLAFIFLCATDYFDGFFARRWNQCTKLGECMDPVADKVLVVLTIVALLKYHDLSILTVAAMVVVLFREIIISGVREYLGQVGETLPTIWAAKVKTGVQMTGLGFMVVGGALDALVPLYPNYNLTVHIMGESIFIIGAGLGFHSAWQYSRRALSILARLELSGRN